MLNSKEKQQYFNNIVEILFKPIINEQIYTTLVDTKHCLTICTNYTAQSIGLKNWQEAVGISYKDFESVEVCKYWFKDAYNTDTSAAIHEYGRKIFTIQQYVLNERKVASFVDILPYDNAYKCFNMTFIPLFYPDGEILGIQTIAVESNFSSFHGHQTKLSTLPTTKSYTVPNNLSEREKEILFLLSYGMTQQQIAQILDKGRGTIGVIIKNQLCVKFGLHGSNTKLLGQIAYTYGFHRKMPPSLWRPTVLIMEDELFNYVLQPHKKAA